MGVRILLVDDDIQFCAEAQEYLGKQGFAIDVESDGLHALSSLERVDPDIVILDIALQKDHVNGLNVCTDIRQQSKYEKGALGIIMISGHHSKYRNWTHGLRRGADRYLVKPFELEVLVEEINSLHSLIAGPESLAIGPKMVIAFDERRVIIADAEVQLTKREFDLLAYLAKPPNKTRSRYELLENVWKAQNFTDGAVARCICTLRQKISPEDPERYVQSVRGVGYRLSVQYADA